MSLDNAHGRPASNGTADVQTSDEKIKSNATPAVPPQDSRQAEHSRQVRGTLVVVVETPNGKYRRRAYLTLISAERAMLRAKAAGYQASIVLARLEPVGVVA